MDTLLLVIIAVWVIGASGARHLENRRLKKIAEPMVKRQGETLASILDDMDTIKKNSADAVKFMEMVVREESVLPVEATRVYAAVLRKGLPLRLHILPALSVEEFIDKSQAVVGEGWTADIVEYLDVFPAKEKVVYRAPTRREKKEMGLREGMYFLQMAKDKFAEGEQKDVMEAIINNYKKTYDLA